MSRSGTAVADQGTHMTQIHRPRLVLGSGSPRRLELLAVLGITPDAVRAPDIDEDPARGELPRPYCARIAAEKVAAVEAEADDIVLCADTTVALGRRIPRQTRRCGGGGGVSQVALGVAGIASIPPWRCGAATGCGNGWWKAGSG